MHKSALPALLLSLLITSCAKDTTELAQDVGVIPAGCGTNGARMQATVDGASYCASAHVHAVGTDDAVVVTGVDLAGNSLILQADTLGIGDHLITEAQNGLLYMHLGTAYIVGPQQTGTLSITHHDPATRTLKAAFNASLFNEASGATRTVQGEIDVVYSE